MTTAVEYRQRADECLKAIWVAPVPEIRALLLSIAKLCLELAEQVERHDRQPPAEERPEAAGRKKPSAPSVRRRRAKKPDAA